MKLSLLGWSALILVLIGAINWGLIGLLNFNLVAAIFGGMVMFTRAIYSLVGISAVYLIITVIPSLRKK